MSDSNVQKVQTLLITLTYTDDGEIRCDQEWSGMTYLERLGLLEQLKAEILEDMKKPFQLTGNN